MAQVEVRDMSDPAAPEPPPAPQTRSKPQLQSQPEPQTDVAPPDDPDKKQGWFKSLLPKFDTNDFVNDEQFIQDVKQLKELRSFLTREAVTLSAADPSSVTFRGLNRLRHSQFGRTPTEEEWAQVEALTQTLFRLLPERLRRKFVLGRIPQWITAVPVALAVIAVLSLLAAVWTAHQQIQGMLLSNPDLGKNAFVSGAYVMPYYVGWLVCLGGIGAVAFIGMNALSVQDDVTFDLMNTRLMILRIVLGAMFGLVLTLPFGFGDFNKFANSIVTGSTEQKDVMQQSVMLLLPFILGFSTPLVILVLNRFVEAVQGFFGKSTQDRPPVAPTEQNPQTGASR